MRVNTENVIATIAITTMPANFIFNLYPANNSGNFKIRKYGIAIANAIEETYAKRSFMKDPTGKKILDTSRSPAANISVE